MGGMLIFGSAGRLGTHLQRIYPDAIGLSHAQCDIRDRGAVLAAAAAHQPEIIVNAAAIIDIGYCEAHPDEAWHVNVVGVRHIAEAARAQSAYLVHFSSDYAVDPRNEYGWTKRASEGLVSGLVLRTNYYDHNHWLLRSLQARQAVRLLDTIRFNPISVYHLLDNLQRLIDRRQTGIINVGVKDRLSYYDFGVGLCEVFGLDHNLIQPVSSIVLDYDYPEDSYLPLDDLERLGMPTYTLKQDLERLLYEIAKSSDTDHQPAS